jgi:ribokinase
MLIFSPNETETEIFTGISPDDSETILLAAKKLAEAVTAKYYVIKLGGRGVAVYDGEKITCVPTYDVKPVDTTSAGDSFTAAMLLEYLRSGDIIRACKYGNAVASITVSRPGAGESIPDIQETNEFIKKNNINL